MAIAEASNVEKESKARRLFNNFEPFKRLPSTPFSMTGRPRSVSVDARPLSRPVSSVELQSAIASILQPPVSPEVQPVQQRARRLSARRNSFTPALPTIPEEDADEVLQFIDSLFR